MTSYGYGISGIGWNPLSNVGLGMSGQFGSYDAYMPSMMGSSYATAMTNPMFAGAMNGMYGMPGMASMYGMYDPTYYTRMQQEMEKSQALHSGAMHNIMVNNEVNALRETDSGLMQKILTNGDIQTGITTLHAKVKEGDQDGICAEYDKLLNAVLTTYRQEFKAMGSKINPATSARQYIDAVYSRIVSAQTGQVSDLMSDIKRYGDSSFTNGFMSTFREGHHGRFVDETLNHIYGIQIDQKAHKDMKQKVGGGLGYVGSALEKGAYGAAAGAGAMGLGLATVKGFNCLFGNHYVDKDGNKIARKWFRTPKADVFAKDNAGNFIKKNGNYVLKDGIKKVSGASSKIRNFKWIPALKWAAGIGIAVGIAADIIWKSSKE